MNILITAGLGLKSIKLGKLLKLHSVTLADFGDLSTINVSNITFKSLGKKNEDSLAHQLLTACLDVNATLLIPLNKDEIESCKVAIPLFEEFGIQVVIASEIYINVSETSVLDDQETLILSKGNELISGKFLESKMEYSGIYVKNSEGTQFKAFI